MQLRRSSHSAPAEGTPAENAPGARTSRSDRLRAARTRSGVRMPSVWAVAALALAGVLLLVVGALAIGRARATAAAPSPSPAAAAASTRQSASQLALAAAQPSATATATASATAMIEIPSVEGLSLTQAKLVLESAGLVVTSREAGASVAKGQTPSVTSQEPPAGQLAVPGDTIRLVLPPAAAAATQPQAPGTAPASGFVVCIDPGHQAHSNPTPEPIGPGAKTTKPSVSGGATGVSTGIPEYEIALQIAMNLKKRLEAQGVKVVMTRTVNDVDIVNSERAAIANKAKADLFIRIHADGSPDSSVVGISTLYPASNTWTRAFADESKVAAVYVQKAMIQSTGAVDRGAIKRSDLSGFNWATVPSVLVEAGFMSNRVEDKLLSSPHYQDKLAEGITAGAMKYLKTGN